MQWWDEFRKADQLGDYAHLIASAVLSSLPTLVQAPTRR